jgi:hypothetical protein
MMMAVLDLQLVGRVHQPPEGDQTSLGYGYCAYDGYFQFGWDRSVVAYRQDANQEKRQKQNCEARIKREERTPPPMIVSNTWFLVINLEWLYGSGSSWGCRMGPERETQVRESVGRFGWAPSVWMVHSAVTPGLESPIFRHCTFSQSHTFSHQTKYFTSPNLPKRKTSKAWTMDIDLEPTEFITQLRNEAPEELRPSLETFADLYQRKSASQLSCYLSLCKTIYPIAWRMMRMLTPWNWCFLRLWFGIRLWYQLTVAIQEFLILPNSFPFQIPLYNHFITDFENKINSLKLVEIAVVISQRFTGGYSLHANTKWSCVNINIFPLRYFLTDGNDALEFLTKLAEKLKPVEKKDNEPAGTSKTTGASSNKAAQLQTNAEAYVLARMSAAHFCLLLGKTKETESTMDECWAIIDKLDSVDTSVRSGFYRVSADYFKVCFPC